MRWPPVARFVLAVCLFAAWLSWLIYLAATHSRPVILSQPQLLVSEVDVLAEVSSLDEPVLIKEMLHGKDKGLKAGDRVRVLNLRSCKRLPREKEEFKDVPLDWTGPGVYLLPLKRIGDHFEVADIPPSPGYPPREFRERGVVRGFPRIYPVNEEMLRQYRQFRGTS